MDVASLPPAQEIETTRNAADVWRGIGGHFDALPQVIAEFVDNAVANFMGRNVATRNVQVSLKEDEGDVWVTIEDSGTGIPNLAAAINLGDKTAQQAPLNEHGFGIKHALAAVNPENNAWEILTRRIEDFQDGYYWQIAAPFDETVVANPISAADKPWPGLINGSGTLVRFKCSKEFFKTISAGVPGTPGFETSVDYLEQDLGFVYAGIIKAGQLSLTVITDKKTRGVAAVEPKWAGPYAPGSGTEKRDLGGGTVEIDYSFGEMKESDYRRYYRRNMSTSGLEVRINGRVIEYNLFKPVWKREPHPSFNHFLAIVDIRSQTRKAVPTTRTSKNGIRSGDPRFENLLEWVRGTCPNPPQMSSGAVSEKELVKTLEGKKIKHLKPTAHVETEFEVFKTIGSPVKADLYVFDGSDISIYEAKKDEADVQAVYQLVMYWDGLVSDGQSPAQGILLATTFSPGVEPILDWFNNKSDADGNPYRLARRTWHDEDVDYPQGAS